MNPCPCGYYGDPVRECRCSWVPVQALSKETQWPVARSHRHPCGSSPSRIRQAGGEAVRGHIGGDPGAGHPGERTTTARLANSGAMTNADMGARELEQFVELDTMVNTVWIRNAVTRLVCHRVPITASETSRTNTMSMRSGGCTHIWPKPCNIAETDCDVIDACPSQEWIGCRFGVVDTA